MVVRNVIKTVKMALENMDKKYCTPSQIDYSQLGIEEPVKKHLKKEKYLERPFAYEFYHQFRKLMDKGDVDFGGPIIQAEVDKRYQHLFKRGKIPDFIIHIPNIANKNRNLAVIEFKLATNLRNIKKDLEKLTEFKKNEDLKYKNVIEVIIGNKNSLEKAIKRMKGWSKPHGQEIVIIGFNTDSWRVYKSEKIKF